MANVTVSFKYQDSYLPTPKSRKFRYREAEGTYSAVIREVTRDEFPIALRFEDFVMRKKPSGRCWIDLHWYDGQLWKLSRYCDLHANKTWDELTPLDALGWYLEPRAYQVSAAPSKEKCIECIDNNARNWLLCEGKLYVPSGEPMYGICTFGLGHNHAGIGTSLDVECYYNGNLPSSWYFNALQREEAIAKAKEIAYKRGDTNSISFIEDAERIEVLMPECVQADPQSWNQPGDSFLTKLENITESAGDATTAGIAAIMACCR